MNGSGSQTEQDLSPECLVTQVAKGDKLAEQQLVSRYWRGLYFILHRRTNDPELAADLSQDTFIVVINKARNGEINNPAAVVSFIRQTGINLMIAHYRKESRQATDPNSEMDSLVVDVKPGLFQTIQSEQTFQLVLQLIEEMKVERDREILKAYFLYEQDKANICETLKLSSEHFDRVLHRARSRLKQLFEFKYANNNEKAEKSMSPGVVTMIFFICSASYSVSDTPVHLNFCPHVRENIPVWHLSGQDKDFKNSSNSGEEYHERSINQLRAF